MKKIMFSDAFGLTKAVLEGRKTMTRRIVPGKLQEHLNAYGNPVLVVPVDCIPQGMTIEEFAQAWNRDAGKLRVMPLVQDERIQFIDQRKELIKNAVRYKVGEVVAVAQAYRDIPQFNPETYEDVMLDQGTICEESHPYSHLMRSGGWDNKMFVKADLMPHQLRITSVRVERLQDISDGDVYKEGFSKEAVNNGWGNYAYHYEAMLVYYDKLGRSKEIRSRTPREAFAALIDKVSGKGVWESNPFVFVYEFELVK